MISRADLNELVAEWGLRDDVIEKDYVIGWLLWGIGSQEELRKSWAFKGGTSLKKCFIETCRFSEDLDFTVLPDGPIEPEKLQGIFKDLLSRIYAATGIDFTARPPRRTGLKNHSGSTAMRRESIRFHPLKAQNRPSVIPANPGSTSGAGAGIQQALRSDQRTVDKNRQLVIPAKAGIQNGNNEKTTRRLQPGKQENGTILTFRPCNVDWNKSKIVRIGTVLMTRFYRTGFRLAPE